MLLIVKYVILSDQSETTSVESAEIGGSFGTTVNLVSLGGPNRGILRSLNTHEIDIVHPASDHHMCFTSHLFSFQSL